MKHNQQYAIRRTRTREERRRPIKENRSDSTSKNEREWGCWHVPAPVPTIISSVVTVNTILIYQCWKSRLSPENWSLAWYSCSVSYWTWLWNYSTFFLRSRKTSLYFFNRYLLRGTTLAALVGVALHARVGFYGFMALFGYLTYWVIWLIPSWARLSSTPIKLSRIP